MSPRIWRPLAICLSLATSLSARAATQFKSYAELNYALLNLVGKATQRIWLQTSYITEGEMVVALFLAKNRGLTVETLLSASRANSYMSRLRNFKDQQIPVLLYDSRAKFDSPTSLLIDHEVWFVNSDLDFMTKHQDFELRKATSDEARAFEAEFSSNFGKKIEAKVLPYVPIKEPKVWLPANRPLPPTSEVYNYDRRRNATAREGLPRKLPKEPIYLMKQREKEAAKMPEEPKPELSLPGVPPQ